MHADLRRRGQRQRGGQYPLLGQSTTGANGTTTTTGASGTTTTTGASGTTTTTGASGTTTTTGNSGTTTTTGASGTTTTTGASGTTTTTGATAPPTTLTGAYELFCPGTPVGDVVLNDAMTSATLSPADPTAGQSFMITGYQTVVNLPNSLASAAASLQPNLSGTATAQIDASGATPATTPVPSISFNVPIPSPVPADGVTLVAADHPETLNGFTATSDRSPSKRTPPPASRSRCRARALSLTCTAYPNDSVTPSGIVTSAPTATAIAPVIAVAGGTAPTKATATASSSPAPTSLTATLSGGGQMDRPSPCRAGPR